MADDVQWRYLLPEPIRALPVDLGAVVVLTVLTVLSATVPGVRETPLRIALGLPFVLFFPGYALIAALFPEAGTGPSRDGAEETTALDDGGIDGIERVALSFGLSIAVTPLIGLVLNFTPWGIRLVPILVGVGGFTLVAAGVASERRRALEPDERFQVPYREWLRAGRAELFAPATRMDAALNVLLVVSVLLAAGSVGYAIAVPQEGESFTEFYVLTETEDGELVADDYPTEFVRGESKPLVVGIGNHEHRPTNYTVVVELQDVEFVDNATRVSDQRELSRFRTQLAHNETWHHSYEVTPTMTGTRLRLQLLLYRGDAPENPRLENSYRDLHLWVNVTDGT